MEQIFHLDRSVVVVEFSTFLSYNDNNHEDKEK